MIALTHAPSPKMESCELTYVLRAPIDLELARSQHANYCQMLRECGAEVTTLTANLDLPDCCFIEDTAIVLDEVAVLASMGATSRRAEPAGIEPELRKYRKVLRVELPATFDGGDVLRVGRSLFVGKSSRTNDEGIKALVEIAVRFGYKVLPVQLKDCLHFKSACTALPDGSLLVNPAWLDLDALHSFDLVPIPPEEAFAADVLTIGTIVCVEAAHPRTAELIRSRGFEVKTIDLSEFAKAEGGVTCLSILFSSK
jgi:dimethylargininase